MSLEEKSSIKKNEEKDKDQRGRKFTYTIWWKSWMFKASGLLYMFKMEGARWLLGILIVEVTKCRGFEL